MWFNNKTLRSHSDWGLSLTLKELVMWAFFPCSLYFQAQMRRGAGGGGRTNHWVRASGPPCQWQHTGGASHKHIKTCTHWFSWRGLISFGRKGEGLRVRQERGWRVERKEVPPPPTFGNSSRGPILKASLSLHRGTGCGRGAGRLNLRPRWSALGAPRCSAIHDNQSERRERESEGTWKSSAAVRERSVGAERWEQSTQWFSFLPLCLLYIVHRRVTSLLTGNKEASKEMQAHTAMST